VCSSEASTKCAAALIDANGQVRVSRFRLMSHLNKASYNNAILNFSYPGNPKFPFQFLIVANGIRTNRTSGWSYACMLTKSRVAEIE